MSRRSRKSGSAITLFSFQDIIMSTSGIMIMIVLILCLELIQRSSLSASPTQSRSAEIQERSVSIQEEIDILERQIANANSLIGAASEMTASEMNEKIRDLQTVNQLMSSEQANLQARLNQLVEQQPKWKAKRQELVILQQRLQASQRELESTTQELENDQQSSRPIFSLPRGETRTGWIVDISATRIQVAPLAIAGKPLIFESSRKGLFKSETPYSAFLIWKSQLDRSAAEYFFLFVRPDGVGAFEEIAKAFDQSSTSYGFDIAEAGQTLLHPERGAAE